MLRIWLTEYNIDPITGWGAMCGPNIEAPSIAIAQQICKSMRKKYGGDLQIQGQLISVIPTKSDDPNDPAYWVPDWDRAIDYDVISNN